MQNGLWATFLISVLVLVATVGYAFYLNFKSERRKRIAQKQEVSQYNPDTYVEEKAPKRSAELEATLSELDDKPTRKTLLPVHSEVLYETQNIDTECFYYFKGSKILLVEDNKINQKIVQSILQKSGIDIVIANNGEEALEILNRDGAVFDLILMDISMPVMDGIEATRQIRLDTRFDEIPIVTFTAFAGGVEIAKMFKVGSNAFLTKPLNINQLYTAFKIYIKQVYRDTDLKNLLKTEGLDVSAGLVWSDGDEESYKERLKTFYHRYAPIYKFVPKWIEEKRYDRVKVECFQLQSILDEIGAYEMKALIDDMIKDFIYKNEHLLPRFIHIYPVVFKTLLNAIEQYLESDEETLVSKSDR